MTETEFDDGEFRCQGDGFTILVADDCAAVVAVTRRMLEDLGYRVLTARDGEQTISVFQDHRHDVDLVILDMMMPRMGGKETWHRLRQIEPRLPVLVCSGYAPENRVPGRNFLQKPFDMGELADKVTGLLHSACP